jgi:hypothetical protein
MRHLIISYSNRLAHGNCTRPHPYGECKVKAYSVSDCVSLPVSSPGRILEQTFSTTLKIILCTSSRANMMSFPTSTSVAVAVGGFGTLGGADIDIQHSANVIPIQFDSIQLHTCHTFVFFLWLRLFQCALSYRAVYQTVILEYGLCRDGSLLYEAWRGGYAPTSIQTRLSLCPR